MEISNKKVWIIMSKDKKVVGKGTPRNRELILVSDVKDKKRLLTYSSKGMAESGFRNSFFSQWRLKEQKTYTVDDMEGVEVNLTVTTVL